MSERTFKIADAILDSAIEEYRNINLANEEAVEQYAFEAMGESITSEEARAILDACNEYLAVTESPDFDGEGQKAFDHIVGALKDFRLSHGGQRIGAGRKNAGTKAVLVRLTDEQHETLKKLGGSSWIQNAMNAQKDVSGKSIVIDFDFGGWEAMTPEEVDKLEKDWGETAWNENGPYICTSPKDAIALIADQIECETQSNLPNIDKIDRLNDLLKEFVKLI